MHIIEQIQNHPRPPISLNKEQVESLSENVNFLQESLEGYSNFNGGSNKDSDALESRIADAAYAAEDIIESHIVDRIQSHGENVRSIEDLYDGLQQVIHDLGLIKKEVTEIKEKMTKIQDDEQLHTNSLRRSPSSMGQNTMVGFDGV
ncbi:hypothetical protein PHJA_002372000 [Phtheirospermum japonicum]|uniref:Uncharacterized protein n=1 Tax=Phtheirospermum japonicum TaxID=374723 RepID=A0A830CTD4_9LAMI|nr:hypothetical protein PHJA_002372000 [Phtheirospermum japonicum]